MDAHFCQKWQGYTEGVVISDDTLRRFNLSVGSMKLRHGLMQCAPLPPVCVDHGITALPQTDMLHTENDDKWVTDDQNITQLFSVYFLSGIHIRPQRQERVAAEAINHLFGRIHKFFVWP